MKIGIIKICSDSLAKTTGNLFGPYVNFCVAVKRSSQWTNYHLTFVQAEGRLVESGEFQRLVKRAPDLGETVSRMVAAEIERIEKNLGLPPSSADLDRERIPCWLR